MSRRDLLLVLASLSILTAVVVAEPSPPARLGVKVSGPLDSFNLSKCFYRDMEISLSMSMENLLSPTSPPPWCPSRAPVNGSLTCSCWLEPAAWWPNATLLLTLPPSGTWSTTVATAVPEKAALGPGSAGYGCSCLWGKWCRYVTTVISTSWVTYVVCAENTIIRSNTTTTKTICYTTSSSTTTATTATKTSTTIVTHDVGAFERVTVLPRSVNQSLLGIDLNVSLVEVLIDYPLPGKSSALVNLTAMLYNLGLGARAINETLVPPERGMLLLRNLTVLVNNAPVISCGGYCAPAHRIPVNESNATVAASITGSAELILEPPERPTNSYTFNVTICYTEDKPEPVRTCISGNVTVSLPFGWRETVYLTDGCHVIQERWEVVPPNETGYETMLVADEVKPSIAARDYCIVATAGACEPVRLRVFSSGLPVASRMGRGEAKWCPVEPGTYTAVAVDGFNNTASKVFTLTWSAGPPPTLRSALLRLSAILVAFMVALYIILEGRWPLRGP